MPKFLANKEWTKDIKFNNHWYRLKSLFDLSVINKFDFNQELFDVQSSDIDFNQEATNLSINNPECFDFNQEVYE